LDAIESSNFSEQGVETKVKLEETCVLVDGEELHFLAHKECKRRPYKVLCVGCVFVYVCMCILPLIGHSFSEKNSGSFFFKNEISKEAGV